MDRLFLRFHLKLWLSLLVAALLARVLVVPHAYRRVNNHFEDFLAGPMFLMAEALHQERDRPAERSRLLERTAQRFRTPVAIVPRQQLLTLAPQLLQHLDRGEVVGDRRDGPMARLYIAIPESGEVLRLGPLRPQHPFGEWRGLTVVLLFLAGLSIAIDLLVRPLRRNLKSLAQAAEAFRRGALTARAEVRSRDAVGELASLWNRMAEEIQRLIATQRELLQMVSHELRTPLQRIHLSAAIAHETKEPEKRERALTRMEQDLHALDELLDELLHYIRLEREVPLRRQRIEIGPLLAEIVELQSELIPSVAITVHEPAPCPAVDIDAQLVRRALSNLIGNAMRHAASRAEISAYPYAGRLYIDIDDDGPGVPPAERQRIFEPFHRLDSGATHAQHGYGLGLAIVRRITDRHSGSVEVGTSPLGGARFRWSIPI